ncbi:MAG: cation acetate symporter [Bacillota bacterium]|nr:cation acetate symporter [Bacillota bacterium]
MLNLWAILMVVGLIAATVWISVATRKFNRTAENFYLAGRKIGFLTNASAICGDYFSAASFLGVAAAIYASGLDGVWYATGFGAAFVPVLIFVAGPLRRFGEYTIPDYLAARFQSPLARLIGVTAVQAIAIFYLAPQMVGAGATWTVLVGKGLLGMSPFATGVVVTVLIMMFYVAMGGMKGTTINQMIQFWVLFTAMFLVVALAFGRGFNLSRAVAELNRGPLTNTAKVTVAQLMAGEEGKRLYDQAKAVMSPEAMQAVDAAVKAGDADAAVWVVLPQKNKLHPERTMLFGEPGHRYRWLDQFSMVLALVLGTMGLPHIMNRYYTNPSGRTARWTTVWVLAFVAAFYILATLAGVAGRVLLKAFAAADPVVSSLTVDGQLKVTDQLMPLLGRILAGEFGLGYVAAGAFAAMFSTIGGLLMASAASWGHDIYEQFINPNAPEWKKVAVGKAAVVGMALFSLLVGLGIPAIGLDKAYPSLIAMMVTWAFAVSAGSFVPMFITSIWWKRATLRGTLAGMAAGGGLTVLFIIFNILRQTGAVAPDSLVGTLGTLTFPTVFTVPLGLLVIVAVSLLDPKLPTNVDEIWIRIHGTARERLQRSLQAARTGA